jgi:hypothetical protein
VRVNVDSQALRDPRFRRAAKRLQVSHHEVLARCIHVWMVCYERREPVITREDIDIAAELDGFTDALVSSELAESLTPNEIYVRGVSERIQWLEKQSERGKRSGERRREMSAAVQKRTTVQQAFDLPLNQDTFNQRSISGSTAPRTNSLAHALDQDLLEHEPPGRSPHPSGDASGVSSGDPLSAPDSAGKVAPSANGAASVKVERVIPEPPEQAIMLATLLLDRVIENNPASRIAAQAVRQRQTMTARWAWTIEKLHRIDKQEWGAIAGTIEWATRDTWWHTRILGADSLREHWDKLQAQRKATVVGGKKAVPASMKVGPTAQSLDELAELEAAEAHDKGKVDP